MSLKVDALRARYVAERLEAIATLEIYTKSAVGIGEHPQIIDEMDKLLRKVADMNGYLETLDAIFVETDNGSTFGTDGPVNG
jgi:hypothetical protein